MSEKLKDYQVLDVLCGGTFYKVRHRETNEVFSWRAFDCSSWSARELRRAAEEVRAVSRLRDDCLLQYHSTIVHGPTGTLYVVLEHSSWQSLASLAAAAAHAGGYLAEGWLWYVLHELARLLRALEPLGLRALRPALGAARVFASPAGELRADVLGAGAGAAVRELGELLLQLSANPESGKLHPVYSDDLHDVLSFLTDGRNTDLQPDVILYHPTVLANLESLAGPKNLSAVILPLCKEEEINKCDSEKVVQLCQALEPVKYNNSDLDSPIYSNITPKKAIEANISIQADRGSLSPTIAALALELPGFVPRSRKPVVKALQAYNDAEKVSQRTLSEQWMSRLVALRQREESLNKRERDLISKEIVNSPAAKVIQLHEEDEPEPELDSNGITLPPVVPQPEPRPWVSRRHLRSSARPRRARRSCAYADLDSSLSADAGDSPARTAARPPRRLPRVFAEDDVTLTLYELDGPAPPADLRRFKYLDLERAAQEKRAAGPPWGASPSKQPRPARALADITNGSLRKAPLRAGVRGAAGGAGPCTRARASLAPAAPEVKKSKGRMSLLSFKTPFKFITSTKV